VLPVVSIVFTKPFEIEIRSLWIVQTHVRVIRNRRSIPRHNFVGTNGSHRTSPVEIKFT